MENLFYDVHPYDCVLLNLKEFEEGITCVKDDKTSPGSNEEMSTIGRRLEDVDVNDSVTPQHEGDVKAREKSLSDDDFLSECDYEEKADDLALSDLEQLLDAG